MWTSIDKALVATFGAVVYLAHTLLGINVGLSPETFQAIVMAATPILVYLVPNKPWAS